MPGSLRRVPAKLSTHVVRKTHGTRCSMSRAALVCFWRWNGSSCPKLNVLLFAVVIDRWIQIRTTGDHSEFVIEILSSAISSVNFENFVPSAFCSGGFIHGEAPAT